MVDYLGAVQRPFSDMRKFGIGALLFLIPWLNIITGFFAYGYSLRCGKTAMKKEKKLPEWDELGDLFVKGLLLMILALIYMLPAILIGLFFGGAALLGTFGAAGLHPGTLLAGLGAGIWIAFVLFLLAAFVLPIAMLRYVDKNRFGEGFSFGKVFSLAFTGKYLIAWMVVLGLKILTMILTAWVVIITAFTFVVPVLVSAIVTFWMIVAAFTIYGQVYAELMKR